MLTSAPILQFGEFIFDPGRHELCKGRFRVRMSASQLRLLTLFLARPGQLVSRDEITRRLWKDTGTIDVERGINTAINSLRVTLGDTPAEPVYLETVIGLGYRFIAPVAEREPEAAPASGSVGVPVTPSIEERMSPPGDVDQEGDAIDAKVAQTADNDTGDSGPEIAFTPPVVSQPNADAVNVPTRRPWRWGFAVLACLLVLASLVWLAWMHWSPSRSSSETEVDAVEFSPATFDYGENRVSAAAVSPDGQKVAYADNFGISLHSFDGSPDKLQNTQPGLKVDHLAWMHDGVTLLVSAMDTSGGGHQVWLVEPTGYNMLDLKDASMAEPSPDGTLIAFTRDAGHELWTATIHGDDQKLLRPASDGEVIHFVLWSRDGRSLMLSGYNKASTKSSAALPPPDAWFYQNVDAHTGQTLTKTASIEIDSGFLAQDGALHYVNQAPAEGIVNKDHSTEMTVATDPGTGRLLGAPTIAEELPSRQVRALSASRDGRRKAYIFSRSALDIFVAQLDANGTALKDKTQLTHGLWDAYPHAWTADGSVLFERYLDGKTAIYAQRPGADKPQLLAQMPLDLFRPQVSPDGRWVLFMGKREHGMSLYRMPAAGGKPEEIPVQGEVEDLRCPLQATSTCVLSESLGREAFVYHAFDPVHGLGKELLRTPWRPARRGSWNLSPDGARIAVADDSSTNPGLQIMTFSGGSGIQLDLPLPGRGTVLAPAWSADGKVLYVECRTKDGFSLIYEKSPAIGESESRVGVLTTSPYLIYGVPSPDGKSMALPLVTTTTNVWTAKR